MSSYEIQDTGDIRILISNGKEFKTYYSTKIIEMLIQRKGLDRAPLYFTHKEERCSYLQPLFDRLNATHQNLRVLEVGCSAGHITEYLQEQPSVGEIYAYDVDRAFVDITLLKRDELCLHKVKRIDHFTIQATEQLPYEDKSFDLVIVMAIVEHLPYENRYVYVDEYYKKLKNGGLIGFWDTPNRYFPKETHSIGLPFVQLFPPSLAYIYTKLFKKRYANVTFPEFVRAGTGWRNSSYYELLPKTVMIDIQDVSEEVGYIYHGRITATLARICKAPPSFFTPCLNVVFKKVKEIV